ncbi:hypothetical protein ACOMHN_061638 [Nucella lapillus]
MEQGTTVQPMSDNTTLNTLQPMSDDASQNKVQSMSDDTSRNTVQLMCDNTTLSTVQPMSDDTSQNTLQPICDNMSQNTVQSMSDDTSQNTLQPMCDNMSQNTLQPMCDNMSQNTLQPMSDDTSWNTVQLMCDNTTLSTVQPMSDDTSQNTLQPMSDNMSHNTLQPMSDNMSHNTLQPMSDKTSGSLNRSNTCQRCAAVFMLPRSLTVHMQAVHGQTANSHTPAASKRHNVIPAGAKQKTVSQLERCSSQGAGDLRDDFMTSADHFAIKLEPPWSMKEESHDEPSAVYSTAQPMSDNTSPSLLSHNTSHVCQRCSATFVLFSSLELHMVTFHGETLHGLFLMYSAYHCYGLGYYQGSKTENVGDYTEKAVKRRKEKAEDNDTDRADQEKKKRKHEM